MNMHSEMSAADELRIRKVSIPSGEYQLAGQLFLPAGLPRAVLVLNGATGIPARYYRAFAEWLAQDQQIACLTYDYRDFGASKTVHPRGSKARLSDWAVWDAEAARGFLKQQFPDRPLWVLGHSLGALAIACQRNLEQIDRLITVASGPVHTSDHPWPYQALARLFWFGHAPVIASALGYLPGKKLGFGADLPAGVYWQWRRWCTSRGFISADVGRTLPYPDWCGLTAPVKLVAVADDTMVPPAAVWRAMQFFEEAPKRQKTLRPAEYGLEKIGHIGAFAEKCRAVWPEIIA